GEFASHDEWARLGPQPPYRSATFVDAQGRRCITQQDFARAREPFAGAGPMVRIRFPPAVSHANHRFLGVWRAAADGNRFRGVTAGNPPPTPRRCGPERKQPESCTGRLYLPKAPSTWRALPRLREQIGVSSRLG